MCGIVGIIGTPHSAEEAYQGLLLLQHRGQDAAGILSFDFHQKKYSLHKNQGLVNQVFDKDSLENLDGEMSIGHTRYSTVGSLDIKDVQPLTLNYPFGLGLVHNGNLVNFKELKDFLNNEKKRFIFTKNDGEVIINLLSDHLAHMVKKYEAEGKEFEPDLLFQATSYLYKYAKGGYSTLATIAPYGLLAIRDPNGIRPMILGEKTLPNGEKAHCITSESVVLNFLGYDIVRDLEPGEVLFIDKTGKHFSKVLTQEPKKSCMFEWIYFANPESRIEDKNVYEKRLEFGRALGKKIKPLLESGAIKPDYVVPVPDTSKISATSLSEELGIPLRPLLNKNRYAQRSFILNSQSSREKAVKMKLFPIKEDIEGKNLLIVDDSIVRGTTSKRIIQMLKDCGAKEVYMASTCPKIIYPCSYGIDFPNREDLVAHDKDLPEIESAIGCEKLIYLSVKELKQILGPNLCTGCLTGEYPTGEDYIQGPRLIHKGSVKNIFTHKDENKLGFRFSDRYSVFDWGEMPDTIEQKGNSLAFMGKLFFNLLENTETWNNWEAPSYLNSTIVNDLKAKGLRTHYRGFNTKNNELEVHKIEVPKDIKVYQDRPTNTLIPLEVLFRFGLPKGSSFKNRMNHEDFKPYLSAYKDTDSLFPQPIIDFSTKLEAKDRYLDYSEAKKISGMNDNEFQELVETTQIIAKRLFDFFQTSGLTLWDGKFEFAFGENREITLVDSIGIDELRLSKNDVLLSKEFLRDNYRESSWYQSLREYQKNFPDNWKEKMINDGISPTPLSQDILKKTSALYCSFTNTLSKAINNELIFKDYSDIDQYLKEYVRSTR